MRKLHSLKGTPGAKDGTPTAWAGHPAQKSLCVPSHVADRNSESLLHIWYNIPCHRQPLVPIHSACVVSGMASMSTGPGQGLIWSVQGHPHNIGFGYNTVPTLNLLGVI